MGVVGVVAAVRRLLLLRTGTLHLRCPCLPLAPLPLLLLLPLEVRLLPLLHLLLPLPVLLHLLLMMGRA